MIYDLRFTILKKTFCSFFIIIISFSAAYSQSKTEVEIESQQDSIISHKVMLIPYDPLFYMSDAEQDISEQTKKDPQITRSNFRRTIDWDIQQAIEKNYKCISLLSDGDSLPSLKEALTTIYSKTGYRYDKPMPVPVKPEKQDTLKNKKNLLEKNALDSKIAAQYLTVKGDAQYMNAVVSKPSLLNDLYNQYGTDIFVFVNQFEIKTNYSSCLDIANKIYKRELLLHFSVYDKNGNQLAGTYAMTFFPSDSNNAHDIMKNCFPSLAKFVANCIP